MINYKKLLIVAGASLALGGCSLDLNGMFKGVEQSASPSPSPVVDQQTSGTPNPSAGSMGSGSYSLQGTTTVNDDSDAALEKDLNNTSVNSNLEMLVQ